MKGLLLFSFLVFLNFQNGVVAFTNNGIYLTRFSRPITNNGKLHAKKAGGKKKSTSKGGGFGAGFSSSSKSNNNNTALKTRSISSGHQGSGTKPLRDAANTFDAIRKIYGKEGTNDLYVRSIKGDPKTFWFVGKVVRNLQINEKEEGGNDEQAQNHVPSIEEAVISQKRLILEYASRELRPQNLGGPYKDSLEIWTAPGDSEMDVVQNKVSLNRVNGSAKDISEHFRLSDVGFNPEIYLGDERTEGGLRVIRDEEGNPVKPVFEINQ